MVCAAPQLKRYAASLWGWRHTLLLGIAVGVVYQFLILYVLEPLIVLLTGKSIDLSQFAPVKRNVFLLSLFLDSVDACRLRGRTRLSRLPNESCGGVWRVEVAGHGR